MTFSTKIKFCHLEDQVNSYLRDCKNKKKSKKIKKIKNKMNCIFEELMSIDKEISVLKQQISDGENYHE